VPSALTLAYLIVKPFIFAVISHGTMLLWCSINETRTSSPLPRLLNPHEYATKLMASVVPLTKTTSLELLALMNLAVVSRDFS
jgi:hypothetical protein